MLTHHVTLVFMLNMLLMQVCKCLKFESPNNIEFYVELKRPVSGFKAAKKSCEAVESRLVVADSNETIPLLASKLLKADDKSNFIFVSFVIILLFLLGLVYVFGFFFR